MGVMAVTRTACSYCGVGCGIKVQTTTDPGSGRPVIARVFGDKLHPTNFGRLCTKGATHAEMMAADDGRLKSALLRPTRDDEPVPTPVDDGVAEAGRRLRAIIDEHGPDAVALYVSGQMSIEAQYLATKLAKGFIRTVHIESNSRLCMASAGTGLQAVARRRRAARARTPTSIAPICFSSSARTWRTAIRSCILRMADRLKAGAKLIVVDPRRTTTADTRRPVPADQARHRPGAAQRAAAPAWSRTVHIDHRFHRRAHRRLGRHARVPRPTTRRDRVAEITGLPEADIRTAARMIAEAGEWMSCWTMGLNQSTHGTWNTNAICNLHLATGAICRPGSGPMSLTGQPNAMGGREMGYMGPGLPGQRSVLSADDRAFVEDQWGLPRGHDPHRRRPRAPSTCSSRLAGGTIKACWIICTNPVATVANRKTVIAGLEAAELVITQDAYRDTATNHYADIVLPATLWAESDAVMVNSERNLTLLQQSIPPAGQARPDWQLICQVAAHMGFGEHFGYQSSEEIFDEITSVLRIRRPATTCAAPATSGCGRPRCSGRARRTTTRPTPDPLPQRRRQPGRCSSTRTAIVPRLAFPTPSRRAVFHARPHMDAA